MSFSYNTLSVNKSNLVPYLIDSTSEAEINNLLPRQFDGRIQWKNLLSEPLDQGSCQACWAFASVSALSDRFNIQSTGQVHLQLSPTRLVLCSGLTNFLDPFIYSRDSFVQTGCSKGETLIRACEFLNIFGTFENDCLPADRDLIVRWPTENEINAKGGGGIVKNNANLYVYPQLAQNREEKISCRSVTGPRGDQCDNDDDTPASKKAPLNTKDTRFARHWRLSMFYHVTGIKNIQYDIYRWGTVLTSMQVTPRFKNWISSSEWNEDKIYVPSTQSSPDGQSHSICLVGWGIGITGEYWIVKNSWEDRYYFKYGCLEGGFIESHCLGIVPDFFVKWKRIKTASGNSPIFSATNTELRNIADGVSTTYQGTSIPVVKEETLDASTGYSYAAIKEGSRVSPFRYCEFGSWDTFVAGHLPITKIGLWSRRQMNCFSNSEVVLSESKVGQRQLKTQEEIILLIAIILIIFLILLKRGLRGGKLWETFIKKGMFASLMFFI